MRLYKKYKTNTWPVIKFDNLTNLARTSNKNVNNGSSNIDKNAIKINEKLDGLISRQLLIY